MHRALAALALFLPFALGSVPSAAAGRPHAVSPGSATHSPSLAVPCPTFTWSGGNAGETYELLVDRFEANGARTPVLRVEVPGAARAWTPAAESCPPAGSSYGWAIRRIGDRATAIPAAELLRFETLGTPSLDEVRNALAVLRRYRQSAAEETTAGVSPPPATPTALPGPQPQTVTGPTNLSLETDGALQLGGHLFQSGTPFVHNDGGAADRNTAAGLDALVSGVPGIGNSQSNTALGYEALRNTTTGAQNTAGGLAALRSNQTGERNLALGDRALYANVSDSDITAIGSGALTTSTGAYSSTAFGTRALEYATTGNRNTAAGLEALRFDTTAAFNTGIGYRALFANSAGSQNAAIGSQALFASSGGTNTAAGSRAGYDWTTGSGNVALGIGSEGVAAETGTIRIGGSGFQTRTFIEGIAGATAPGGSAVYVNSSNQLGTSTSSARFKEDIHDLDGVHDRLLALRPVSFRYKEELARGGPNPLEFGLVAEEVAEAFPELAVLDEDGRPLTVRYHLLTPLLLSELQRRRLLLDEQREAFDRRALKPSRLHELERQLAEIGASLTEPPPGHDPPTHDEAHPIPGGRP